MPSWWARRKAPSGGGPGTATHYRSVSRSRGLACSLTGHMEVFVLWHQQISSDTSLSTSAKLLQFSSVLFSHSVVSDSLRPCESQHGRPPSPSQTPGVYSNSCPSSQWCHPTISSSVVPFSSFPQSLPAPGSFPVSQPFAWGGQSIGVSASASVLPMNT